MAVKVTYHSSYNLNIYTITIALCGWWYRMNDMPCRILSHSWVDKVHKLFANTCEENFFSLYFLHSAMFKRQKKRKCRRWGARKTCKWRWWHANVFFFKYSMKNLHKILKLKWNCEIIIANQFPQSIFSCLFERHRWHRAGRYNLI